MGGGCRSEGSDEVDELRGCSRPRTSSSAPSLFCPRALFPGRRVTGLSVCAHAYSRQHSRSFAPFSRRKYTGSATVAVVSYVGAGAAPGISAGTGTAISRKPIMALMHSFALEHISPCIRSLIRLLVVAGLAHTQASNCALATYWNKTKATAKDLSTRC